MTIFRVIPFMTPHIGRQENGEGSVSRRIMLGGIPFMTPHIMTLNGISIIKAESVG